VSANHGWIRDEDVEEFSRPTGVGWRVVLTHVPTRRTGEGVDRSELVARQKAWTALRDKMEGLS
jgi:hypothetical protein